MAPEIGIEDEFNHHLVRTAQLPFPHGFGLSISTTITGPTGLSFVGGMVERFSRPENVALLSMARLPYFALKCVECALDRLANKPVLQLGHAIEPVEIFRPDLCG